VVLGDSGEDGSALSASKVASSVSVKGFSGPTMFETAAAEAKAAFSACDIAIIAGPGDSWVDALASAGLAGALNCPILFTEKDSLHAATKQALQDLGVKNVIVLGGTAAVSAGAENAIRAAGITIKERLGGSDCYGTQMAIFEYGVRNNLWSKELVIFATGGHYGDALSVSPIAYAKKAPIFLINGGTKDLSDEQRTRLKDVAKAGYGKEAVAVGGAASVSDLVVGTGDFISSLAGGSGSCQRLWGATQFETSSKIAEWAVGTQGFSWNNAA
ncbi:MAG: cell wall-binding repeat-containing protein, partial [Raoultibacter sp.]